MLRMFRKRGKGAFTLMELMIVIAIIGILATLAVPSFRKVRLSAKWRACQTNMSTLATAIDSCISESDDPVNECGQFAQASDNPQDIQDNDQKNLVKLGYIRKVLHCPFFYKDNKVYQYCNSEKASCSGVTCQSGSGGTGGGGGSGGNALPTGECYCPGHDACQHDKKPAKHWIK